MDKIMVIIWAIVGLMALIAVCAGATHHFLTLGVAVALFAGEYHEIKQSEKAKED